MGHRFFRSRRVRIHRLIAVLALLESRGRMKAQELSDALETPVRTVRRDVATLCEAGIPIGSVAGPHGGFELMSDYVAHLHHLAHDEVISLFLSGMGIHPHRSTDAHAALMKALAKLEGSVPRRYRADISIVRQRFHFDPANWWDAPVVPSCLGVLRKSVLQARKVRISYRKVKGETSTRVVRPYGMVVKVSDWYLVGYCERRREMRTFKCDRIGRATMLDEGFTRPDSFSLADYWKASGAALIETIR
jgi:predicted DNA-binding transcriptional regulator YafY